MLLTVNDDNKLPRPRVRRSAAASRALLLDAAEVLLCAEGPERVTLKTVAAAAGMAHGNVTHHFGTSSALQAALVERIADQLATRGQAAVERLRSGELSEEAVVDTVFDAFTRGGGRLIGWLAANDQQAALEPFMALIRRSIDGLSAEGPRPAAPELSTSAAVLSVVSFALAASLVGARMEEAAGSPPGEMRRLAAGHLRRLRSAR